MVYVCHMAMVGRTGLGMLASVDDNDSTDSQVVLGVLNVHVYAVVLFKATYTHT